MQIGKYEVHRKYSIPQILEDIVSVIIIIVLWMVTAHQLARLPALVPLHVSAQGEGTMLVPSALLFLIPLLAVAVMAFSVWLSFHPKNFDRRFDASADTIQPFYEIVVSMINDIRLVVLIMLADIGFGVLSTASGQPSVPSLFAIWCLVVIFVLVRIRKRQIKRIEY